MSALVLSIALSLTHHALPLPGPARPEPRPAGDPAVPAVEEITFESLLVVELLGRGGRAPLVRDPIELALARGTWIAPREGTRAVAIDGTPHPWRRISVDAEGRFRDPALRGGYAFVRVESDRDRVLLLDASGHRHVVIDGVHRGGDVYDMGLLRIPVLVRAGGSDLLFRGGRGSLRARLVSPKGELFIEERDAVLPDLLRGDPGPYWAGLTVTNASRAWRDGLILRARIGERELTTPVATLPPISQRKCVVALALPVHPATEEDGVEVTFELVEGAGAVLDTLRLALRQRDPRATHKRTFVSEIDGSVQYYGVRPPAPVEEGSPEDGRPPALVLTLHGAGVDALHQANCYTAKEWAVVVAPTNRRPFGFDWEDWGRLDALEVLADARRRMATDPLRTFLTGHSMGGHGTWIIGAQFPGRFAAIAPCHGWRDFWTYGASGVEWPEPTAVQRLLSRAAHASRTSLLAANYETQGVYVLHGDADRTVPVAEARAMRGRLGGSHADFAYYERPGAAHWWGNRCMDWPPLMEFLRRHHLPAPGTRRHIHFTTVNPAISDHFGWLEVVSQGHALVPTRIDVALDPGERTFRGTTENARRLTLSLVELARPHGSREPLLPAHGPVDIVLDETPLRDLPWPESGAIHLVRAADGAWRVAAPPRVDEKRPQRAGPFKEVFRHRVQLVVATGGTPAENAWALARARFDAEVFQYRGNGALEIVRDVDFDPAAEPERSVVLYGNRSSHRTWSALWPEAPIDVDRRSVRVGDRLFRRDDLAVVAVRPRPGSDQALVGIVAGTGLEGLRTTDPLPFFVSGAAFPDWILYESATLEEGSDGVIGAGFFGPDWSLETGETAWRDAR